MNSVSAFSLQVLVFLSASFTVDSFKVEEGRLKNYDELIRVAGVTSLGIPSRNIPAGVINPGSGLCNVLVEQGISGTPTVVSNEGDCPADLANLVMQRASELPYGSSMIVFSGSMGITLGQIWIVEGGASPVIYEFEEFPETIVGGYSEAEVEAAVAQPD